MGADPAAAMVRRPESRPMTRPQETRRVMVPHSSRARKHIPASISAECLERRTLLSLAPLGNEFRVNQVEPHDQFEHDVAMDAAGNFVVVWWASDRDANTHGI